MRQPGKFAGIGTGVIVGATFATIVAVSAHGGDVTKIHGCVDRAGNIKIVDASATCKQNEVALDWNVQGLKGDKGDPGPQGAKGDQGDMGPPGTFTGTFTSPNQAYSLTVTDTGVVIAGPDDLIRLGTNGIEIVSSSKVLVQSAGAIDIKASGTVTIKGSNVDIN